MKGLLSLFPSNIDNFFDIFGGSGVVTLNTNSKNYYLNDINEFTFDLYKLFKESDPFELIDKIDNIILNFNLQPGIHKQDYYKKYPNSKYPVIEQQKRILNYNKFREYYNQNKDILCLYILSIFSNSHNIRFNKNGFFNMSIGNSRSGIGFMEEHKQEIIKFSTFLKQVNIFLTHLDFKDVKIENKANTFVYLDPPYLDTLAIYNEQQLWSDIEQKELFKFCENLNSQNILFGLSNILFENERKNNILLSWINKNNLIVHRIKDIKYTSCGKGNSNLDEIFITNYRGD